MTKKYTVVLMFLFGLAGMMSAQGSRKLTLESDAKKSHASEENAEIVVQEGHNGTVFQVEYVNDEKWLFSTDNTAIKLWDVASGKLLKTVKKHDSRDKNAAIAPDGSVIVYISPDESLTTYNVQTGKSAVLERNGKPYIAFAPNGKYFVAVKDMSVIGLYDAQTFTKTELEDSGFHQWNDIAISADSSTIAVCASPAGVKGETLSRIVLWDADGLEIKKTIRVGTHSELVTFSPNGKMLACLAKYDGNDKNNKHLVLVDVKSGTVSKTIDLSFSAHDVRFSPDNKYIYVTGSNSTEKIEGLSVWEIDSGKKVAVPKHEYLTQSITFSSDGSTYVLGCYRNIEFRSVADKSLVRKILGAGDLHSLEYLASKDSFFIPSVAAGKGLMLNASFEKIPTGKIPGTTAFSLTDTGFYYATGSTKYGYTVNYYDFDKDSDLEVKKLSNIEKLPSVLSGSTKRNMVLHAGNTVFVYDLQSDTLVRTWETKKDFYSDRFVTSDGKYVVFDNLLNGAEIYEIRTGKLLSFDSEKTNNVSFSNDSKYCAMITKAGQASVFDTGTWKAVKTYRGFGENIISPDNQYFVIGDGDGNMVFYDLVSGKKKKSIFTGNLSTFFFTKDSSQFVCLTSAGIIRCYSVETGELLTSTVVGKEGDWLTYTPEGYFTGSKVGMKEFVHVVYGMDIITIDQMYEELYRPDLIRERLSGKSGKKSSGGTRGFMLEQIVASGDAPNVSFLPLPASSSKRTVTVQFSVEDTGGGVGDVRLSLNGRVYKVREIGQKEPGTVYTVSCDVTLANGENQIEVYATNASGKIESRHAARSITWRGKTALPNLYVLALGVNTYDKNYVRPLEYAVPDASAIADFFTGSSGSMYQSVHVSKLLDGQVTKSAIISEFNNLSSKIQPDDVFVFYLAGHGTMYNGDYYFIPVDFKARNENQIPDYGVSKDFFMDNLSKIKAQKSLIMFDTCNSGTFVEQMAFDRFAHTTGQAIIAASSDVQSALEGYKGHGVFTYAVLDGLGGKADIMRNGTVSVSGLSAYVNQAVPAIAMQQWNRSQTPWARSAMEDFLLVGKVSSGHTFAAASGVDITTVTVSTSLGTGAAKISRPTVAVTQAQAAGNNYGSSPSSSGSSSSDSSSSSSSSTSKSSSKTEQRSRGGGNVMGIYIDLGKLNGPFYSGFAWDSEFYFFGGRHFFGGADLELVFASLDSDYEDYTKAHDVQFIDANFVLGWSFNIWKFRPYVMGGVGYYQSFVEDSLESDPKGFTWDVRLGLDLAFKHFAIGGQYKLKDYLKSGYVDVWTVSFGWTF